MLLPTSFGKNWHQKGPQRSFMPITSTMWPFQKGAAYKAGGQLVSAGMLRGEVRSHKKQPFPKLQESF